LDVIEFQHGRAAERVRLIVSPKLRTDSVP
jgi:hypothetical protein